MVKDFVLQEKEHLISLRRHFHANPEASLCETETAKKIEEELDAYGIPHRRVDRNNVYAWIDGTKKEEGEGVREAGEPEEQPHIIALRADIDALRMQDLKEDVPYRSKTDGVCHACGHDAHTAMLLVAAKLLNEQKQSFKGQIRLFFQQGEEIGQGARYLVKEGLMEGVGRVFGEHVASEIPSGKISLTPGPNNASCDYFKIKVTGKGAHVSKPHLGIDAIYIASQIIVNLQAIVARETDPVDTVVVGVGKLDAGTAYNIVAEHAVLEGTTRTFTKASREKTNRAVKETAEAICKLYGAECSFELLDFAAPLVNDETATAEATKVAEPIFGKENIIANMPKRLGADDFADYLAETKGVYAFLGTGNPDKPNTLSAHHHGLFDLDEDALLAGCELYVNYALSYLKGELG